MEFIRLGDKLIGQLGLVLVVLIPALLYLNFLNGSPVQLQSPLALKPTPTPIATPCPRDYCITTLPTSQPIQKWPTLVFSP